MVATVVAGSENGGGASAASGPQNDWEQVLSSVDEVSDITMVQKLKEALPVAGWKSSRSFVGAEESDVIDSLSDITGPEATTQRCWRHYRVCLEVKRQQ